MVMKIMMFLSSTYNYHCKLWRFIIKELPDTFYLYFCFFFFNMSNETRQVTVR